MAEIVTLSKWFTREALMMLSVTYVYTVLIVAVFLIVEVVRAIARMVSK